jgi:hypothetical protein
VTAVVNTAGGATISYSYDLAAVASHAHALPRLRFHALEGNESLVLHAQFATPPCLRQLPGRCA